MNEKLIFDVGAHIGEDTKYYLSKGYKVIAIDADPDIITQNNDRFSDDVTTGKVQFINAAIDSKDGGALKFYVNQSTAQNSAIESVGKRNDGVSKVITVLTRTLKSLIDEHGTPFYCKIDIEGYDAVALRSMVGVQDLPVFISAETECKPDAEKLSEEGILDVLNELHNLGYTKYKLVDQTTLSVLGKEDLYRKRATIGYKIIRKVQKITGSYSSVYTNKARLVKKHNYNFASDATGPFGNELDGEWIDYNSAKELYLRHRRSFFSVSENRKFSFWADWHATR